MSVAVPTRQSNGTPTDSTPAVVVDPPLDASDTGADAAELLRRRAYDILVDSTLNRDLLALLERAEELWEMLREYLAAHDGESARALLRERGLSDDECDTLEADDSRLLPLENIMEDITGGAWSLEMMISVLKSEHLTPTEERERLE